MTVALWSIGAAVFVSFFLIVMRGAPFVPTHRRSINELFSLYEFQPGEVLVDLGSGDGRVLKAADERGVVSVGYELNPFLALYSWWILRHKKLATVRCRDFWRSDLPDNTAVVFVFLADPFMTKLEAKLTREAHRLGRDIYLISYGVQLKARPSVAERGGFVLYQIKP